MLSIITIQLLKTSYHIFYLSLTFQWHKGINLKIFLKNLTVKDYKFCIMCILIQPVWNFLSNLLWITAYKSPILSGLIV